MATYPGNCYEILSQVRYGIGEYSTAYVQATDTTGSFQNEELVHTINNAQYYLWGILFGQFPDYFLTSADLTFSSSVATLPSDCFKIKDVADDDGHILSPISSAQRHTDDYSGNAHFYYRYGNTLRIDADSTSITGKLWYYSRCRELDTGTTSAGGAKSATLASTAKGIADYYNNMKIENVTDSTVDVISDYTAARVCTVTNTWASSKYYGIVSDLPEIFWPLIAEYAILQMKKNPKVPLQVTANDVSLFMEMMRQSFKAFAGTQNGEVGIGSVIEEFEPMIY